MCVCVCRCEPLIWVRVKSGVLPIMAAAKAGHKGGA